MDLNATEKRTLRLAAALIAVGGFVRIVTAPSPADVGWSPSDSPSPDVGALREDVRSAIDRAEEASRPLRDGESIDPNTASAEQLDRLPGVGPVTAAAIVRHRSDRAGFRAPADLEAVPGIGPALASRLASYLSFGQYRPDVADETPLQRVDVNRAQVDELQQITGVGPVLARRIIEVRARLGRFAEAEDLLLVPGIGPVILAKIRDQVRFE